MNIAYSSELIPLYIQAHVCMSVSTYVCIIHLYKTNNHFTEVSSEKMPDF